MQQRPTNLDDACAVVWLGTPESKVASRVGGKFSNLGRLAEAGFPVPVAFCLPTDAYRRAISDDQKVLAAIATFLGCDASTPPETLRTLCAPLQKALRSIRPDWLPALLTSALGDERWLGPEVLAVRSSATAEDQQDHSFAGQYESFLGVEPGVPLIEAVLECWASLWSPHAVHYRLQCGLAANDVAMAVVCQALVPAKFAGVLFTRDPRRPNSRDILITSVAGLAEELVSGSVPGTETCVSRDTLKPILPRPETDGVSNTQATELATIGLRIEALLGVPVDVEWAHSGSDLWIVQARPITGLPPAFEELDPERHWDRRVLGEWLDEPLTPMFRSLLVERLIHAADDLIADELGRGLQSPITRTINGYLYVRADIRPLGLVGAALRLPGLIKRADRQWTKQVLPSFRSMMQAVREEEPSALTDSNLVDFVQNTADAAGSFIGWVLLSAVPCLLTESLFAKIDRWVRGDADPLSYTQFLTGTQSQITAASRQVEAIVAAAQGSSLREFILCGQPQAHTELPDTSDGRALIALIEEYLAEHGHTSMRLDLVHPTLSEDPRPLWEAIRAQLRAVPTSARLDSPRTSAEPAGLRGRLWQWSRRLALRYLSIRDDRPYFMQLAWPHLRGSLLELGERFIDRAWLVEPTDIFFLEFEEVVAAITRGEPTWMSTTPAERRELWHKQRSLTAPDFVNRGALTRLLDLAWRRPENTTDGVLAGFAGAPGEITGKACVVLDPGDYGRMAMESPVLVTRCTTPAWSPLLAMAAGVVTEIGSPLSHAAIVAREYGIPCVIGVREASKLIPHGAVISVDGGAGLIRKEETR